MGKQHDELQNAQIEPKIIGIFDCCEIFCTYQLFGGGENGENIKEKQVSQSQHLNQHHCCRSLILNTKLKPPQK